MTDPEDPPRLFDDPSAATGLKDSLRAAAADVGSDAQVARLARRLGPLLGAGAVGAGAGAGAGAAGKAATLSGGAKLGLAALALVAAGSGVFLMTSGGPTPPKAPLAPAVSPTPVAPAASEIVSSVPSVPAVEQPAVSVAPPAEKPAAPAQLSEVQLLEQARLALKSDPNRALQRANEHARRFPRGVLVQEREVLAIQALRRLGRDAEADRRAEAFAKAFPGSAFRRNLKPGP